MAVFVPTKTEECVQRLAASNAGIQELQGAPGETAAVRPHKVKANVRIAECAIHHFPSDKDSAEESTEKSMTGPQLQDVLSMETPRLSAPWNGLYTLCGEWAHFCLNTKVPRFSRSRRSIWTFLCSSGFDAVSLMPTAGTNCQHHPAPRSLQQKFGTIPSVHAIGGVLAPSCFQLDL